MIIITLCILLRPVLLLLNSSWAFLQPQAPLTDYLLLRLNVLSDYLPPVALWR